MNAAPNLAKHPLTAVSAACDPTRHVFPKPTPHLSNSA